MPRKVPNSAAKKKAKIKIRRAVKRGEIEAPEPVNRKKKNRGVHTKYITPNQAGQATARKLQSAFTKLSKEFLEETKILSASLHIPRPLPIDSAILPSYSVETSENSQTWTCPRRPKWNYEMSKKDVESNEEGIFKKWLAAQDTAIEEWQVAGAPPPPSDDAIPPPADKMPRSVTYFERNLDVWRELWRVTEISQIILVLLDSRCPLLHYPPSLAAYLKHYKHILILTKVDIAGPERTAEWLAYFKKHYPDLPVVPVESYAEKEAGFVQQGRKRYEPFLPETFRTRLVDAVQQAHKELVESPPQPLPKGITARPKVKKEIDWESVRTAQGGKVGSIVGGATEPRPVDAELDGEVDEHAEPTFLTVGVIGQPNVGKSSLLNALFGASRVRASKTPGMTKHLQTLFWTQDIRLVDCPGLVMPNLVPMEMQVLSGILPIARISAVPACTYFACQHLPLEKVFKLTHPNQKEADSVEDKRTWRDGQKREITKELTWSAMDVLTAYALKKGWVTAQAGRPDIHRAGNAILRALAEGRIAWAFWPQGTDPELIQGVAGEDGLGTWIPRTNDDEHGADEHHHEDPESESVSGSSEQDETDEEGSEDEDDDAPKTSGAGGRFGALSTVEGDEESDSEI